MNGVRVLLVAPNDGATADYISNAFKALGHHVTHYDYRSRMFQLGQRVMNQGLQVEATKHDLVLILKGETITPGTMERIAAGPNHPKVAYWTVDPRDGRMDWVMDRAKTATHFFTTARGLLDYYANEGIEAHWLLEACDPERHQEIQPGLMDHRYPVSFVGTIDGVPGRDLWLLRVRTAVGDQFHAFGSHPGALAGPWHHGRAEQALHLPADIGLSWVISHTYVNLGRDRNPEIAGSYGARLFRTLAAGGFLLTNHTVGLLDDFPSSVGTYGTDADCVDQIRYWLQHPEERERIARTGQRLVLEHHTFQHRVKELLGVCGF